MARFLVLIFFVLAHVHVHCEVCEVASCSEAIEYAMLWYMILWGRKPTASLCYTLTSSLCHAAHCLPSCAHVVCRPFN